MPRPRQDCRFSSRKGELGCVTIRARKPEKLSFTEEVGGSRGETSSPVKVSGPELGVSESERRRGKTLGEKKIRPKGNTRLSTGQGRKKNRGIELSTTKSKGRHALVLTA